MPTTETVKHLILTGVKISDRELGRGAFATVYEVDHNGGACAAKEVHSILLEGISAEVDRLKRDFLQECVLHSKLDHTNVVKMLGVYYRNEGDILPVLVMEMMKCNLATYLKKTQNISMHIKLSILLDVSRGVQYLHSHRPAPLVHRDLSSNNILLTNDLVAKISDFVVLKVVVPFSSQPKAATQIPGTVHFMPPEALASIPRYGLPLDVFSFGCVVCHVISQQWPAPSDRSTAALSEAQARQRYIDLIENGLLKQLVVSCLGDDPEKRPKISQVCGLFIKIMADHYSNDKSVEMAYSMASKEGMAKSRDLQVLLVGAENSGKTCLISSFLGKKFVEGQAATEAVEIDACKIYCKDWTKISDSDQTDLLYHQFVDQLRGKVVQEMIPPDHKATDNVAPSVKHSVKPSGTASTASAKPTSPSSTSTSMQLPLSSDASQYNPDSLNLTLWDFPGQIIFHNTHSVFISVSGVITITFNAHLKVPWPGQVTPREGSPPPQECTTIISGIHYWLQVVDSMCSQEGEEGDSSPLQPAVILAGTHIDLINPDIKTARKFAKETLIPHLISELSDKHYAQHLVGMREGIEAALEKYCFFVSNKCRDAEIKRLKSTAIDAATSLKKKQPIYFLKIERAILQSKERVVSKSKMAKVVADSTFPINENSPEFRGVLKYFHDKRVILYFSQIESLKDLVILSPQWLARLVSYIITAHSFKKGKGFDEPWKRLNKYGILHESLLQHMLGKFHLDYPGAVNVSKEQVVDILLHFHLVARITREAWFTEESHPSIPDSGDTFIVPSLVPRDDGKCPPNSDKEKTVYFKFDGGFIPTSLLNQLIAECICRNVKRNMQLLWMRHGMIGLQFGADQMYYISRCEEKESIQLTITMPVKDDTKSGEERRELIDDIISILDDIMQVFMPAVKKRPALLVPCPNCAFLHITLDRVIKGETVICTASGKDVAIRGHYADLLPHGSTVTTLPGGADRKLEVLTKYYQRLASAVNFEVLCPEFISQKIISNTERQRMTDPSSSAKIILDRIEGSLRASLTEKFDEFLIILQDTQDSSCIELANQMDKDSKKGSSDTKWSHDQGTPS